METTQEPIISDSELRRSYWIVQHKDLARRTAVGCAIVTAALIACVGIFRLILLYGFDYPQYRAMAQGLAESLVTTVPPSAPQAITVATTGGIATSPTTLDAYAIVQNPNSESEATIQYAFTIDGVEQPAESLRLAPSTSSYVFALSKVGTAASNISVTVKSTAWQRLSARESQLHTELAAVKVSDFKFFGSQDSGLSQALPISKATFTLENPTGYTLSSVRLPIVLTRGGVVVAVQYLMINDVKAGERKPIETTWSYEFDGVDSASIIPELAAPLSTLLRAR